MTDLQTAIANLEGHTIALCKGGNIITDCKRGIAPMADFLAEGRNLCGYSVADLIVGRAAALLFVKAGIREVYAKTISAGGAEVLRSRGIPYVYETLTDKIINRQGTDICPMERTVQGVDDPDEAYLRIRGELAKMKNGQIQPSQR